MYTCGGQDMITEKSLAAESFIRRILRLELAVPKFIRELGRV